MTIGIEEDEARPSYYQRPIGLSGGPQFYFGTWSGRILIINTIIFILMTVVSKSVMQPSEEVLINFGAQDPIRLVQGEWWRLLTPIFVHIGLIHFFFNSYALSFIGPQIESFLGAKWFLILYLLCGICGNIASGSFHVMIGAGASGAIFGLIGAGLVLESYIRRSLPEDLKRSRMAWGYTILAILNLLLGAFIPGIDNAAHIGGLIAGVGLTVAMLRIRPNRLMLKVPKLGYVTLGIFLISWIVLASLRINKESLHARLNEKADEAYEQIESSQSKDEIAAALHKSYYFLSRLLLLDPDAYEARYKRGRILMIFGEQNLAMQDLRAIAVDDHYKDKLKDLYYELLAAQRIGDAEAVRELFE
ncbi:MAG: rhomboid family intramembrane serine protease [Bdellovibrionota bacterium]